MGCSVDHCPCLQVLAIRLSMSLDVYGVVFVPPSERYHTPWSDVRSPTRELKLGYIAKGQLSRPEGELTVDTQCVRRRSQYYGGHGEGGGNTFEHYFKGAMADADTRSKPTGPVVDGSVEKGASFEFLSAALQGLFGFHPSGELCPSVVCPSTRDWVVHPPTHDWAMPPSGVYAS